MSEEQILCFNDEECIYDECPRFHKKLDTCGFIIIGLLRKTASVDQPIQENPLKPQKAVSLEVGKYINLEAPLIDTPQMSEGTRRDGTEWKRANFTVNVNGAEIRVTLWDKLAVAGMEYKAGQYIRFKGIRVDQYKNQIQLTSSTYTEIVD